MDIIEKCDCDNHPGRIHYYIGDRFLCVPKSLPDLMLLQYMSLIEIFGFCIKQRSHGSAAIERTVEFYSLYFYIN